MTDSELGGASPTPARTASEQIIADAVLLGEGRHPDPFRVLGRHGRAERIAIRAFWPGARQVYLVDIGQPLQRLSLIHI